MLLNLGNSVIDIKEFNSNNQLNEYLQKCDLGKIKLGDETDNGSKFYAAIIRPQTGGLHYFGIGICAEGYGCLIY